MLEYIKHFVQILFLCNFIYVFNTNASTIQANSCSSSDLQAAIDSASDGDTIFLPTCKTAPYETWNSVITVPKNKGIKIFGQGIGETIIVPNGNSFNVSTDSASSHFGFGYLTFYQGTAAQIHIHGTGQFRIHHIKFDHVNGIKILTGDEWTMGGSTFGPFGVIDHCQFIDDKLPELEIKVTAGDDTSWAQPNSFGGANAVFIEDCTFNYDSYVTGFGTVDCAYGGRYVFRYNTVINGDLKTHGYESSLSSCMQVEVYDNNFSINTGSNIVRTIFIRGGSGYIYNNTATNTISGYTPNFIDLTNLRDADKRNTPCICDGSCYVDGNTDPDGWLCREQLGSGYNHTSVPFYEYNNTVAGYSSVLGENSSNIAQNRDYYISIQKPNYIPYTYPHPLVKPNYPKNFQFK